MMAMLKVNGQNIPSPSAMELTLFDIGQMQRAAAGSAHYDRVATKRRLKLRWARLDAQQLSAILCAVGEAPFFEVEYPDAQSGEVRSMLCSCGEKSVHMLRMAHAAPIWVKLEMEWTER